MDITLEMVDQVRERTGATYEEAKKALEEANGNVVDAIIAIEKEEGAGAAVDLNEKIKEAIHKGNVTKIRLSRDGKELATIPVTAGAAVGVLGLVAAPWAIVTAAVAGAVAKYGLDCRFELIKEDGSVEEILPGEKSVEQPDEEKRDNEE